MPSSMLLFVTCLYGIVHFHNDFKIDPETYIKSMSQMARRYRSNYNMRKFGTMPFMMMFLMHDEGRLRWILESGAIDVNQMSHKRYSALHIAAFMGKIDAIYVLTEFHANLNARASDGTTPLLLAVSQNHTDVVRYLIDSGSDVNIPNNAGITPLEMAVRNNFFQIIAMLIDQKPGIVSERHRELDALHVAAKFGCLLSGHTLIEHGYDINRLVDGESPLHVAVANERTSFAKMLLSAGAKCNSPNHNGIPALHLAVAAKSVEMVKTLLQFHCDPFVKDIYGRTPLHLTSSDRDLRMIRIVRILRRKGYLN